jgi:hypothetical protein
VANDKVTVADIRNDLWCRTTEIMETWTADAIEQHAMPLVLIAFRETGPDAGKPVILSGPFDARMTAVVLSLAQEVIKAKLAAKNN